MEVIETYILRGVCVFAGSLFKVFFLFLFLFFTVGHGQNMFKIVVTDEKVRFKFSTTISPCY